MGEGNLYKRNGIYWFRATVSGKEHRGSLRTRNARDAERRKAEAIEALKAEAYFGERSILWPEAVLMWRAHVEGQISARTIQRYAVSFKMCEGLLTSQRIDRINGQVIADLIAYRKRAGASPATVRRDLTAISGVLTYAEGAGLREGNPTLSKRRTVKERRDPIILPDHADIDFVIGLASARFGAYMRAALMTGCRQGELARVTWRDFSPKAQTLTLHGKGNKRRTIDLSGEASAHFSAQPPGIGRALIFADDKGDEHRNPDWRSGHLMRTAEREAARQKRDFRRFRFHDLRHLYAVESLRKGTSIYDVSQHLGHTSVSTTEIYLAHLTPSEAKLAKYGGKHAVEKEPVGQVQGADNA